MKKKYPQLKEFYYTDKNAYQREWRKLNPRIKDEWRKLDKNIYDELPSDVVAIPGIQRITHNLVVKYGVIRDNQRLRLNAVKHAF